MLKNTCQFNKNCKYPQKLCNCSWIINNPPKNNCFWDFISKKSNSEGYFAPLSNIEISKLLGINSHDINELVKYALISLWNNLQRDDSLADSMNMEHAITLKIQVFNSNPDKDS